QHMEFSIEDILDMHRHWITKLYVEDGKTDVEIVGLLRERGFIVTWVSPSAFLSSLTTDQINTSPSLYWRVDFVTCHHGPDEAHEVETTLCHVPNGPTPLETYTEDEQSHEMLALGLERDRVPRPS
ncbi:uncharacterized protein LY89DRAFT_551685, partial [Mollisia scopiformis]